MKIISLIIMLPMLITGLVLTPINIQDPKIQNDICSVLETKIKQEVKNGFVLVSGKNCNSQTEQPEPMNFPNGEYESFTQVEGQDYNIKSGFRLDKENNNEFEAQHFHQNNKIPADFEMTSVSGTFAICIDPKNNTIRSNLNADEIISSTYKQAGGGSQTAFKTNFKFCRLGEDRYILNFSGIALTNLFKLENIFISYHSRDVVPKSRYSEIGVREDNIDLGTGNIARVFNTPYGIGKIVWNGIHDQETNTYKPRTTITINFPDECINKRFNQVGSGTNAGNGWTECIKPYRDQWYQNHNLPIPTGNNDLYTPFYYGSSNTTQVSTPTGLAMATPISFTYNNGNVYNYGTYEKGNCIVTQTHNPLNPEDQTPAKIIPISYIVQKKKQCSWDIDLYTVNPTNNNINGYRNFFGLNLQSGSFSATQATGTALMGTKVFNSPDDFPIQDFKSNVSYSLISSTYFDELPMANPEGGINEEYADNINICTNFSCITNKYELPVQDKEDYPPFPEFPDFTYPEFTPPEYDGQTGIGSGFWQLLIELVGYIVDTIRYMFDEAKNLVQDILFYVIETIAEIADDFLEWLKWFATFVFPEDYDFEGLQLLVSDAFENSPATVGVESFRNVFTTIEDEWTARGEANTCKVFYPEVTTGFFKGFKIDICGISQGMDWGLYRGLLSFVIILAGLMTSTKMIYKMITLGKNPAREIVGGE